MSATKKDETLQRLYDEFIANGSIHETALYYATQVG